MWVPSDFGQARMAALAWRLHLAQTANQEEQFTKALREARGKPQNPHAAWDWYYLQLVRWDSRETYEATKFLATKADPAAQWAYLTALSGRTAPSGPRVVRNTVPGAFGPYPAAAGRRGGLCSRSVSRATKPTAGAADADGRH